MLKLWCLSVACLLGVAGCLSAARAPEATVQTMDKAEMAREAPSPSFAAAPAPPSEMAPTGGSGVMDDEGMLRRPASPRARPGRKGAMGQKGRGDGAAGDARGGETPGVAAPPVKRMVHYNGYLKLKVPNPTETLQQVAEIADAAGGYVEALSTGSITVRVPVAEFRKVYARLASIGDVLSRSLTAQDVTDQFTAMDLRVKTLRASRDRLIALLAKATRPREKLELLAEISRLTEEIDRLEMYLTTLASLAELSRLTVEAVPHQVELNAQAEEPIAVFRWIHQLSPFRRDIAFAGDRLAFTPPAGMVELSEKKPWACESADGAVVWASAQENRPVGDTAFWVEAIKARLGREYGTAEVVDAGPFKVLRLVDQSEKAYRYLIGVRAVGDELQLVEVYYPAEEQEKRYGAAVQQMIAGGAQ